MKDIIKQELQEIAPFLGEIRKPPSQQLRKVPEGYFQGFEEKLESRLELQKELEEQAPLLAKLPKAKLGKLPENYFQQFEEQLYLKLEEEVELDESSTFLNQLGKPKQGLPADYFESFESRLMERIAKEETEETPKVIPMPSNKQKSWWRSSTAVISIAASFLLLVLAGTWWIRGEFRSPYQRNMAMNIEDEMQALQLAEAEAYLLRNIDDLDTEELLENIEEDDLEVWSQQQTAAFIPSIQDSIPPKTKQENINSNKKENTDKIKQENIQMNDYQTEVEEDVLDETDLDDLATDLSDDDFAALEAALLKPQKQ